ncbi:hypothetical protein Voc01_009110 [Virgisporangium ochraceum]|uniref:Uncharacterized protein n=1 Tax=Virgisporangium ochraceum TaxID=65505 RepID=A0A8J4E926_9ACTN|nr:hypothetical protein Voc01_009110 [Virgisporangium ochraceum]
MSGYTVTITPSGGQSGPQTTIQVDTTSGSARVTELTVRAGGSGLSPQELPVIDLAGLVAALAPGSAPALAAAPAAPAIADAPATPARGRRARKAAAEAPKKSTRGRRRGAAADEAPAKAGRAYRRMPAQDEVVAAWNETRSATQVANHFGVPRHTATGWLRRLRQMGVIESSS